jgi:hypothetical protein
MLLARTVCLSSDAVRGIFKFWIQKRPSLLQHKNTDKFFLLQSPEFEFVQLLDYNLLALYVLIARTQGCGDPGAPGTV